jgi:hypothetical protein
MRKQEAATLWVGAQAMPCVSWARGERGNELCQSWIFRVTLPIQRRRRDEASGGQGRPFSGFFEAPIPAGQSLVSLQAFAPRSQEIVTSFVFQRTLSAAVERLVHGAEVEIVLGLGPRRSPPSPPPPPRYPPMDRPMVARLRRLGHVFLQTKKRLPACSEIAAGLGIPLTEARRLAILTGAPLCEESVTAGALPRLRVARERDPALWHLDDFIGDKSVVPPSDAVISMDLSAWFTPP